MNSLSKTFSKISEKVTKDTQARRLIDMICEKKVTKKFKKYLSSEYDGKGSFIGGKRLIWNIQWNRHQLGSDWH